MSRFTRISHLKTTQSTRFARRDFLKLAPMALSPPTPLSQNYLGEGGGKSFRPMRIRQKSAVMPFSPNRTTIFTQRRAEQQGKENGRGCFSLLRVATEVPRAIPIRVFMTSRAPVVIPKEPLRRRRVRAESQAATEESGRHSRGTSPIGWPLGGDSRSFVPRQSLDACTTPRGAALRMTTGCGASDSNACTPTGEPLQATVHAPAPPSEASTAVAPRPTTSLVPSLGSPRPRLSVSWQRWERDARNERGEGPPAPANAPHPPEHRKPEAPLPRAV
jgi:hypothetical protein